MKKLPHLKQLLLADLSSSSPPTSQLNLTGAIISPNQTYCTINRRSLRITMHFSIAPDPPSKWVAFHDPSLRRPRWYHVFLPPPTCSWPDAAAAFTTSETFSTVSAGDLLVLGAKDYPIGPLGDSIYIRSLPYGKTAIWGTNMNLKKNIEAMGLIVSLPTVYQQKFMYIIRYDISYILISLDGSYIPGDSSRDLSIP